MDYTWIMSKKDNNKSLIPYPFLSFFILYPLSFILIPYPVFEVI